MIVSTSHVDRKIDFAEGEEERADRERIYRALGDFGGRRGMEGGDQAESVQHFCAVTAATPEQARFFLESCAWQLETAIHSFFENDAGPVPTSPQDYDEQREEEEEDEDDDDEYLPATEASRTGTSAATTVPAPVVVAGTGQNRRGSLSTRPTQGTGSFGAASGGSRPKPGKEKAVARSNGGRGGITTLSDLNKHPDSDSDSDGPQEYYTGGEKSGMMVQDPTHKSNRDVDSIFDRARQFGAREGTEAPPALNSRGAFSGQGRTLSGALPEQRQTPIAPAPPTPVFHTITFWRNGFTVDDGPLRRLDDPANAPFLASINKTECPRELEPADRNTPVHVNLVKKDEEFQAPPEPKYVAFQGTGRTLGSSVQQVDEDPAPPAATPVSREFSNQILQGLVVDDTKPATSIQLRLQDGTRLVARFNHSHTVADIRGFIDAARPGHSGPYSLQSMGFPPKQLSDPTQTVEQAGLINAVVIQK